MWDLRTPSGILFTLYGLLLAGFGLLSPGTRAPLAEVNMNLYGGGLFLAVGLVMLWMARRAA
jgi:hypothetical protein